jgi:nitrogen fixation NifU-like protein
MYHEDLIEHYKFPDHRGTLENPTIAAQDLNPSCGDQISIQLILDGTRIAKIAFTGSGCIISQASADMLCAYALNKEISDLLKLTKDDILNMVKIELGPTRLKCALLAVQVLHRGINDYLTPPASV